MNSSNNISKNEYLYCLSDENWSSSEEESENMIGNIKTDEDSNLIKVEDDIDKLKIEDNGTSYEEIDESPKVSTIYTPESYRKEKMPIDEHREDIINYLNTTSTVIIHGPTGCGKSTQVPQFIMDDCQKRNVFCNVVVTQPRRIAAVSVAKRVCDERKWKLGTVCGYKIALDNCTNNNTILQFVTTRVLLNRLILSKHLKEFSHIIVDEVHERTQEVDFLLLLIRRFLYTNSPEVKIVLMSATFNTDKFAHYFRTIGMGEELPAPTLFVTKESKFTMSKFYLDQLRFLMPNMPQFEVDKPMLHTKLYELLVELIIDFDNKDFYNKNTGHVLVFLPGFLHIEEAHTYLTEAKASRNNIKSDWLIIPLHSTITNNEQRKVFMTPNQGTRKIILSTNIAESSITVTDIEYVIDFCLTKLNFMNPITKYQTLRIMWASRANCVQRAGRVGRVRDGKVYRMVPQAFYESHLMSDIIPAMLTEPLENLVLSSKLLDMVEPPKTILSLAIDPPELINIDAAILTLKEVGGLLTTVKDYYAKYDGDLTFLGRIMSSLPIDIRFSKLICLGYMFSCLEDSIIIAAGCSLLNIFTTPFQEKMKSYVNKLMWADGSCSDLIAHLNLYKHWDKNMKTGAFRNVQNEREWCQRNYVSHRAIREWSLLVEEIKNRLTQMGIEERVGPGHVTLGVVEQPLILQVIISGAFYPNYYRRSLDDSMEQNSARVINGLNPLHTVYYQNMDQAQPVILYAKRIKELVKPCSNNIELHFSYCSKIYVSFMDTRASEALNIDGRQCMPLMPGKIPMDVYKAIKMRHINLTSPLRVMNAVQSHNYAKEHGINVDLQSLKESKIRNNLPSLHEINITIIISHVISAGQFFAQIVSPESEISKKIIDKALNTNKLEVIDGLPILGHLYCAKLHEINKYFRCKVIAIRPYLKKEMLIQILFIDLGNTVTVQPYSLYKLPKDELNTVPPQALEFVLSEIQPSVILNPKGQWSQKANDIFIANTKNIQLTAHIYSIVNSVISVEIYKAGREISFNKWLVQLGYAQALEENFISKENHAKRLSIQQYSNRSEYEYHYEEEAIIMAKDDVEPPPLNICNETIKLRGPYSTLEMKVCGLKKKCKPIIVDSVSVNSVLLDSQPQDKHERLIVATVLAEHEDTSTVVLRNTTLMMNIHGFPTLMALMFCPSMVPKPVEEGTSFGAILCGLGQDEITQKSLYPDHDIVISLDTVLGENDLIDINELRFWMNHSLDCMEKKYNVKPGGLTIDECQQELKKRITALINKSRTSQEIRHVNHAFSWNTFLYFGDILQPREYKKESNNEVWKLHWTMALRNEDKSYALMAKHLEELHDIAQRVRPMTEITCILCNISNHTMYTLDDLRLHLCSKSHRSNERQFLEKNETK